MGGRGSSSVAYKLALSKPEGMSEESYEQYRRQGFSDEEIAKIWQDTLAFRERAARSKAADEEKKNSDTGYQLQHRPGNPLKYPDEVATADKILSHGTFPDDVLSNHQWYADGYDSSTYKSVQILKSLQGKPNKTVTVYRGAPKGELNQGDWVTLDKSYAKQYAGNGGYSDNPNSKVYSYKVKASELSWDGDSFMEFGYWGNNKKAK